ncbi:Cellulose synthase-like B3, putative isoform 2 [Theobroma cacao]|uniref:Cellulose synthase-like B3, putative isoform 2 n=1 Tax=Theobroma cacao TaxID=3641 RepID=A0A061DKQ9_THECC|nr:Cellulose synthase-like B3, putative isoform 2 [Theobroma cacao]
MADELFVPLYEKIARKNTIQRSLDITLLFLLVSLLGYRLFCLNNHGLPWFIALVCELWFTFNWVLVVNCKWSPVEYKTYPENLERRFPELPNVDMFVTTADPVLEPPIIAVNNVLSLLAADYPADKLACYVSDDGCFPLTFYSLVEASKFAKLWVPFCKKYKIQVRAPFRYFFGDSEPSSTDGNLEFQQDWLKMKAEYEVLARKIEEAARKSVPCDLTGDFAVFCDVERRNHPTIIKIIVDNKEIHSNAVVPNFVYISREKAPKQPHHYKAGAMNVLYMCRGIAGIQGPFYGGTGCFHRRKVIYGVWPRDRENEARNCTSINGKSVDDTLLNEFGNSEELINSAVQALKGKKGFPNNLSNSLEAACKVASCSYEYGTSWGTKCGWIYGATAEDLLTGLKIHAKGWNSALHMPELPGFMGCTPSGGPEAMAQQKRWATGLAEILVGKNCPIIATLTAKLQFRMCLAYLWILFWGLRSIPQLCYAALPAYCILANSHFLPKVEEPAIWIPIATFVTYNLHTLREYLKAGLSIRAWWNNLRMGSITATSAYLFGLFAAILKLLRISETVFEVTQKDQSCDGDDPDVTKFTFNESAVFVPGTTLLLVHLISLLCLSSKLPTPVHDMHGVGLGEVFCSLWVVLCFWPFLNGLFERGKYGIPLSTILKSAALALLFVHFCRT